MLTKQKCFSSYSQLYQCERLFIKHCNHLKRLLKTHSQSFFDTSISTHFLMFFNNFPFNWKKPPLHSISSYKATQYMIENKKALNFCFKINSKEFLKKRVINIDNTVGKIIWWIISLLFCNRIANISTSTFVFWTRRLNPLSSKFQNSCVTSTLCENWGNTYLTLNSSFGCIFFLI